MEQTEQTSNHILDQETREYFQEWDNKIRTNQKIEEYKEEAVTKKSIEIAKNLLSSGLEINFVAKNTGLTKRQVKEIKKNLEK